MADSVDRRGGVASPTAELVDGSSSNPEAPWKRRLLRLGRSLAEDVDPSWGDAILILNCFVTGLLDSAVFNVWGCFVSMQTGNTVYVGLGFASQPPQSPYRWVKSLTAIVSFLLGAFAFSRLSRALGPLRRRYLVLSFLLQALLIFLPALFATFGAVPKDAGDLLPDDFIVLLPLALLSFQSAGQCIMSRSLGFTEIASVVLTSAYADLMGDERLFTLPVGANPKRNRRAAAVLFLLAGTVAGGFASRDGELENALWSAGCIKLAVAAVWAGWKGKDEGRISLE